MGARILVVAGPLMKIGESSSAKHLPCGRRRRVGRKNTQIREKGERHGLKKTGKAPFRELKRSPRSNGLEGECGER